MGFSTGTIAGTDPLDKSAWCTKTFEVLKTLPSIFQDQYLKASSELPTGKDEIEEILAILSYLGTLGGKELESWMGYSISSCVWGSGLRGIIRFAESNAEKTLWPVIAYEHSLSIKGVKAAMSSIQDFKSIPGLEKMVEASDKAHKAFMEAMSVSLIKSGIPDDFLPRKFGTVSQLKITVAL